MSSPLYRLYSRLPAPARSAAATLRGWYLQRWRRSAATERLIAETLERDHWSPARWRTWRDERLAVVLHRAATLVPYYRDQWQARRRRGDHASYELLENWPPLGKETVRANPRAFLADDCDPRSMFHEHTSGTTGTPIEIWRRRETVTQLYAIAEARTRRWDGIPRGVRWARMGGQLVVPMSSRRPPFWVWNAAMHQLYLSTYHLAPDLIASYLDALVRYRIEYIAGYPSSINVVARHILRVGRSDIRMRAIYTNAEPLYPEQRETIAAAFQCPVRETYGMAESVAAASECPSGRLHHWPEFGLVERDAHDELVCTGLLNADMPLIRYRVGDHGPVDDRGPCPCGRTLPAFGHIRGRTNDVLLTRDGHQVSWVNPVFYGIPLRSSQIVQETLDRFRVHVAPVPEFSAEHEATIIARLRERMGDVHVVIERVDEVPRGANGKLRAVVCNLSSSERAAALGRWASPSTLMVAS
jgi:phenylacetate-CoA ligase